MYSSVYITTSNRFTETAEVAIAVQQSLIMSLSANNYLPQQLQSQRDQLQQREAVLWGEFFSTAGTSVLPLDQPSSISSDNIISQPVNDPILQTQQKSQPVNDPILQLQSISQPDSTDSKDLSSNQQTSQVEQMGSVGTLSFDSSNRPSVPVETDLGLVQFDLSVNSNLEINMNGHWVSGHIIFDQASQHYYLISKNGERTMLLIGMQVRYYLD